MIEHSLCGTIDRTAKFRTSKVFKRVTKPNMVEFVFMESNLAVGKERQSRIHGPNGRLIAGVNEKFNVVKVNV